MLVPCELEAIPSPHGLAVSPVGLLAEVRLDLLAEHQHAQVRVRRLVHGFGLDAHAVLLRGQLVGTVLLVPQVEQPRHRGPDHHQLTVQVLPVKVNILAAPAFHFQVKTPNSQKVRPILTSHPKAKIPPETRILLVYQLLLHRRWYILVGIDNSRIVKAEYHRIENLFPRLSV